MEIFGHALRCRSTEVMDQLNENLPNLDKIILEIEELADSGGNYLERPHVIEVTLPMLCRSVIIGYMSGWNYEFCILISPTAFLVVKLLPNKLENKTLLINRTFVKNSLKSKYG